MQRLIASVTVMVVGVLIAASTLLRWYDVFVPYTRFRDFAESGNGWDANTLVTAEFWTVGYIVAGGVLLTATGVMVWRNARRAGARWHPPLGLIAVVGVGAGVLIVDVLLHDVALLLAQHADAYGAYTALGLSVVAAVAVVFALPAQGSSSASARGPIWVGSVTAVVSGVVVSASSWLPWFRVGLPSSDGSGSLWDLHRTGIGYNGANRESLAPFIVPAFRETSTPLFEGQVLAFGGLLMIATGVLVLVARANGDHASRPRLIACILELWVLAAFFTLAVTINNRAAIGSFMLDTGATIALIASIAGLLGVLVALLPLQPVQAHDVSLELHHA